MKVSIACSDEWTALENYLLSYSVCQYVLVALFLQYTDSRIGMVIQEQVIHEGEGPTVR